MTRIIYQTDDWGNAGEDRIELDWPKGNCTFITITDGEIIIHSDTFLKVTGDSAINKLVIVTERSSARKSSRFGSERPLVQIQSLRHFVQIKEE